MEFSPLGTVDPLKARLHRELKERIANGRYPPGSQLPSEAEMVEQYGVSRSTVRSALSALEAEGAIVRRWGVGTFVREHQHIAYPITEAMDFRELIAANGFTPGVSVGQASLIESDSDHAAALAVPVGSALLKIEKIFRADGIPVIYVVNRVPAWVLDEQVLREVLAVPDITEPIYRFLGERCHQQIDHHVATLRALLVRDCEIPIPGVDPMMPVLAMHSVAYSREERPVFESRSTYPDPRVQLKLVRRPVR
jgi:GntR family transcriptional regulator